VLLLDAQILEGLWCEPEDMLAERRWFSVDRADLNLIFDDAREIYALCAKWQRGEISSRDCIAFTTELALKIADRVRPVLPE
jgi:hypothetical protein